MKSSSRLELSSRLEPALVVIEHRSDERILVQLPEVGIRRVADDDGEALVPFDFVHRGGFVGEGVEADERELSPPTVRGRW